MIAKSRAQSDELRAALSARREAATALDGYRARELFDAAAPDASGRRRIVERREAGSVDELRSLAQRLMALGDVLFIATLAAPPTIVVASSDSGPHALDAGAALKKLLAEHDGRGGGNARIAQGTVPTVASLDAIVQGL